MKKIKIFLFVILGISTIPVSAQNNVEIYHFKVSEDQGVNYALDIIYSGQLENYQPGVEYDFKKPSNNWDGYDNVYYTPGQNVYQPPAQQVNNYNYNNYQASVAVAQPSHIYVYRDIYGAVRYQNPYVYNQQTALWYWNRNPGVLISAAGRNWSLVGNITFGNTIAWNQWYRYGQSRCF